MGGLEKITTNLANYLSKQGHFVAIVCLFDINGKHFELDKKIKIISFKSKNNKIAKFLNIGRWIVFLKRVIQQEKPTNVLAMTLKIASLCSLAKNKKHNFRLTMREISDPKSKVRSRLFDRFCFSICKNKVDNLIFQTNWEKSCYPNFLQKKGFVIPNPVEITLKNPTNIERAKEIVSVGRLENLSKRHDVLLNAFSIFLQKNKDFKLIIYGKGPDLQKDLKLCKKLNITSFVEFPGSKNNVLSLISNASCFVLSSEFEGMSNALIEALLIGVPCITTNWNGANEIIVDGYNGLVVEKNNSASLAFAMNKLVNDKELSDKFSHNGILESNKYNFENTYLKYVQVINGDYYEEL